MYDYKKLKKSKTVKMKKEGENFFLNINRFDQNTGEKKEPLHIMLHKDRVEKEKAHHEKAFADADEILKDMKYLEEKEK